MNTKPINKNSKNRSFELDSVLTIAVFSSIAAVAIVIVYLLGRIGFNDGTIMAPLTALASSWLVINIGPLMGLYCEKINSRPITLDAVATICGCLVLVIFGYASASLPPIFTGLVTVTGIGAYLLVLAVWAQSGQNWKSAVVIIGWFLFSVVIGCALYGRGYQSSMFEVKMVMGGGHQDTLFHCAIASMIKTYNVASTGLDGIPQLNYHTGSHWLLAQLSKMSHINLLNSYNLMYPVLCVPLLFKALPLFAIGLRRVIRDANIAPISLGQDILFWFIIALAHLDIFAKPFLYTNWRSYLASESYEVGLVAALLFLTVGCGIVDYVRRRGQESTLKFDAIATILASFAIISYAFAGYAKMSLIVLLGAICGYIWLRKQFYRSFKATAIVGILFALGLIILYWDGAFKSSSISGGNGIQLLHYVRTYVRTEPKALYFLLFYIWFWLYAAFRLWDLRINSFDQLKCAWKERLLLDVEIILVVVVLGTLPGLLVAIPGGSAYYFADFHRWLAVAFMLAYLERIKTVFCLPKNMVMGRVESIRRFSTLVIIAVLAAWFTYNASWNAYYEVRKWFDRECALRAKLICLSDKAPAKGEMSVNTDQKLTERPRPSLLELWKIDITRAVKDTRQYQLITKLRELGQQLTYKEKRVSALYIPKSNKTYWELLERCTAVPFCGPCLTGLAMINGLPSKNCNAINYGYRTYDPKTRNGEPGPFNDLRVCLMASQKGFDKVFIVEEDSDQHTIIRPLQCSSEPNSSP